MQNNKLDPEYRTALVNAWITVRLEEDKTLVALSSAGIGLLVTLLTTLGLLRLWYIPLYLLAFSGFFLSICNGLIILRENAKHIELILGGDKAKCKESTERLERHDSWTKNGFIFALIMSIILGLSLGSDKFLNQNPNFAKRTQGAKSHHERAKQRRGTAGKPTNRR